MVVPSKKIQPFRGIRIRTSGVNELESPRTFPPEQLPVKGKRYAIVTFIGLHGCATTAANRWWTAGSRNAFRNGRQECDAPLAVRTRTVARRYAGWSAGWPAFSSTPASPRGSMLIRRGQKLIQPCKSTQRDVEAVDCSEVLIRKLLKCVNRLNFSGEKGYKY